MTRYMGRPKRPAGRRRHRGAWLVVLLMIVAGAAWLVIGR